MIPEEGAENRVTPNGRLGIYRTRDGGASWDLLKDGLPEQAWIDDLETPLEAGTEIRLVAAVAGG